MQQRFVALIIENIVDLHSILYIEAPTEAPKPAPTKSCMSTVLCMLSCKTGYSLGATGTDGCQTCTCVARKCTSIALLHVSLLYLNLFFYQMKQMKKIPFDYCMLIPYSYQNLDTL